MKFEVTMNRQVERELKLSNGLTLPKGAHIGVAAGSNAIDPELYPNPAEFDGLRFLKLCNLPGNDNKYHVRPFLIILTTQYCTFLK